MKILATISVLPIVLLASEANVEVDVAADGSTKSSWSLWPTDRSFDATFANESPFRVDLYYDDGHWGKRIATLDNKGGASSSTTVKTFPGHRFWFTRHGVREMLVDPETDKKIVVSMNPANPVVVVPDNAVTPNNPCQDRFPFCQKQATSRGCEQSPGWMTVHCCESCDPYINSRELIDPKKRCSRERLNTTHTRAWEAGSLDALMRTWVTDPAYAQYTPTVWSSPGGEHGGINGPWVMTFDTFLTDEEADALIEGGRREGFQRSTDQGKLNDVGEREKVVSKTRTSANAWCMKKCTSMPLVQGVTKKIEDITGIPEGNYESFQILEYEEGEFYKRHHDSNMKDQTPPGPRIMTFFLYLSDVEEGGETRFSSLGLTVSPSKGRALVWPSVTDADPETWDVRTFHEAMPVIKGVKYAANHWIHLYDYKGPNHWGCTGSFS